MSYHWTTMCVSTTEKYSLIWLKWTVLIFFIYCTFGHCQRKRTNYTILIVENSLNVHPQNIGIVVWMIGVLLEIINPRFAPMAGIGSSISTVAIMLFSINIWQGVKLERVGKSSESNLRL